MNNDQKKVQSGWEVRQSFSMPKGKSCNLETIINDVRRHNALYDIALAQYKNEVHPWVYYNYVIDWSAVPANKIPTQFNGDPLAFGRYVIDKWHDLCFTRRYSSKEEWTSIYTDFKELQAADSLLLSEHSGNGCFLKQKFYTDTDGNQTPAYRRHVELLWERKQEAIDREAERQQQELVRLEAERQQALADGKSREADRLQAEANRQRADAEAKAFARQNRDFQTRANSPWSSSVTDAAAIAPANQQAMREALSVPEIHYDPATATAAPESEAQPVTIVPLYPTSTDKSYRTIESYLVMADRSARTVGLQATTSISRTTDGEYHVDIYIRKEDGKFHNFTGIGASLEKAFPDVVSLFSEHIDKIREEREAAAKAAQLRAQAEAKAAALRKELEDERRAEAERQKARDQKQRDLDELNALLSRLNH